MVIWQTAIDWDGAQSEEYMVHESVNNTDHVEDYTLKKGLSIQNSQLSSGLVAFIPFHENSGTTAYEVENGYTGTIQNDVTTGAPGILGTTSYYFNGSNNGYVDMGLNLRNEIDGGEEASVTMWVKNDKDSIGSSEQDTHSGLFKMEGGGSSNTHYPWSNDDLYFSTFRNNRIDNIQDGSFDKAQWHLLTVTTTPGTDGWKLYQNTNLVTAVTGESSVSVDGDIWFGLNSGNHYYTGNICWIMIHNRVITESEIQYLYDVMNKPGTMTTGVKTLG